MKTKFAKYAFWLLHPLGCHASELIDLTFPKLLVTHFAWTVIIRGAVFGSLLTIHWFSNFRISFFLQSSALLPNVLISDVLSSHMIGNICKNSLPRQYQSEMPDMFTSIRLTRPSLISQALPRSSWTSYLSTDKLQPPELELGFVSSIM
jgi:hypothetical protein